MADNKIIIGFITLTLLLSGIAYIQLGNQVKIRVDNDITTFYLPHEDYSWLWTVVGREQNRIFDGTSIMNRDAKNIEINTTYNNDTGEIKIVRTTPYQRGPIIKDTYLFNGSLDDVTLFPISHTIEIINGSGYYYRYTAYDLIYSGEKRKLDNELEVSFGRNMNVELHPNYRWAWIGWPYKLNSLSAQYDIKTDYEVFNIRLFDPPVEAFIEFDEPTPVNATWLNVSDLELAVSIDPCDNFQNLTYILELIEGGDY